MVYILDFVPTEWEYREPPSHQMIENALTWCQDVEASLGDSCLATITVQEFREIFKV